MSEESTQPYESFNDTTQDSTDPDSTQLYDTEEEQPTQAYGGGETTDNATGDSTSGYAETDLFGDVSDDEQETAEKPTEEEQAQESTESIEPTSTEEEQPMPTETTETTDVTQADLFGDISDDEKQEIEEPAPQDDVTALTQADIDEAEAAATITTTPQEQDESLSQKRSTSVMKKHKLVARGEHQTVQTNNIQHISRDADLLLVKLPNVVGIEIGEFDEDTYQRQLPLEILEGLLGERTINKETNINTPGVDRRVIRLAAENVIRWRRVLTPEGIEEKQSNARIVRWSDGSTQLLLGKEVFEVVERHIDNYQRNMVYANAKNNVWRAQGFLKRTMKFRPLGVQDESHKKLGDLIAQTHIKQGKIKRQIEPVNIEERKKISEQAAKSADKQEAQARKNDAKRRRQTQNENKKMSKRFLENDEGEEGYDYSMKRDYQDDDDRERRLMRAKKRGEESEEGEVEEGEEEDSDSGGRKRKHEESDVEEEEPVVKKPSKGKRRKLEEDEEASDED